MTAITTASNALSKFLSRVIVPSVSGFLTKWGLSSETIAAVESGLENLLTGIVALLVLVVGELLRSRLAARQERKQESPQETSVNRNDGSGGRVPGGSALSLLLLLSAVLSLLAISSCAALDDVTLNQGRLFIQGETGSKGGLVFQDGNVGAFGRLVTEDGKTIELELIPEFVPSAPVVDAAK